MVKNNSILIDSDEMKFVVNDFKNELIVNYSGITYEWKGNYTGRYARIGIYRNSGRRIDIKYPSQSIHFDDFIVVSDKKTLDNFLK